MITKPYFKDRQVTTHLVVTCGRCEGEFYVHLKKDQDHPRVICPKCKVENRIKIVWK